MTARMMLDGRTHGCGRPNKSMLAWIAVAFFIAMGTVAHADPATAPFDVYDNYTLDGETIRTEQNATVESCTAACTADKDCVALTFNKWDKVCILRKSTGSFAIGASFQSAIRSGTKAPGAAEDPILMQCLANLTGPGGGKDIPNVASKEACEDACQNDGECVSFSYATDKSCKTYTSVASLAPSPSSLFGFKTQIHKAEDREAVEQCKTPASAAFDALLDKATLSRGDLETAYKMCEAQSYCTEASRKNLADKGALIADEEATYNGAKGNKDALAAYIVKCKLCEFSTEAQTEIKALSQAQEPEAAPAPPPEAAPAPQPEESPKAEEPAPAKGIAVAIGNISRGRVMAFSGYNYPSEAAAKETQLRKCQAEASGCRVISASGPGCIAAAGIGRTWSVKGAGTLDDAKALALRACRRLGKNCKIFSQACNSN